MYTYVPAYICKYAHFKHEYDQNSLRKKVVGIHKIMPKSALAFNKTRNIFQKKMKVRFQRKYLVLGPLFYDN